MRCNVHITRSISKCTPAHQRNRCKQIVCDAKYTITLLYRWTSIRIDSMDCKQAMNEKHRIETNAMGMYSCLMNATVHLACTFNDVVSYTIFRTQLNDKYTHVLIPRKIYSTCSFGPIQHSDMRTTIARIITTILFIPRAHVQFCSIFFFWLLYYYYYLSAAWTWWHLCGKLQCARTLKFLVE